MSCFHLGVRRDEANGSLPAIHGLIVIGDQSISPPQQLPIDSGTDRILVHTTRLNGVSWWTSGPGAAVQFFLWGTDLSELYELFPGEREVFDNALAEVMARRDELGEFGCVHRERDSEDADGFVNRLAQRLAAGDPEKYIVNRRLLSAEHPH